MIAYAHTATTPIFSMPNRTRPVMPLIDPQELARRNNESAATFRLLEAKRRMRRRLKSAGILTSPLLDALDRMETERAARPTRAVGFFLPKQH